MMALVACLSPRHPGPCAKPKSDNAATSGGTSAKKPAGRGSRGKKAAPAGGGAATTSTEDKALKGEAALDAAPYRLYSTGGPASSNGVDRKSMDRALEQYSGARYGQINGDLRKGGTVPPRSRKIVKDMDAAMASSRLTSDIQMTRTVQAGPTSFGGAWKKNMAGVEYRDGGFTSVSANPNIHADVYLGRPDTAILNVRVPKGTHAVSMARPGDDLEMEVLLNRGLNYRVTGDRLVGGVRHLDVEVVS